ncbi:DUF4058 family protein [Alkalinema pantanalense CENA528]|uniref:DUF4058 family protein n=1 Tax=Alkalinema pantanalense TaxID=1620705 RepID=UPI003D6E6584
MPSPFPGMNPYLETPALWSEVHSWLIVELARLLNSRITPKYRAAVEKRVYEESVLVGIPDVAVVRQPIGGERFSQGRSEAGMLTLSQPLVVELPESETTIERYIEVREVATGRVVTVIEVLSPKNKRSGEGRDQYLSKRLKVLSSQSHLIEIDLLRGGEPMPMKPEVASDYRVLVSRVEQRGRVLGSGGDRRPSLAELYAFSLRDGLPCFPVPLLGEDVEPIVDLNALLRRVYEAAALEWAIDYSQPLTPPLQPEDREWVEGLLGTMVVAQDFEDLEAEFEEKDAHSGTGVEPGG